MLICNKLEIMSDSETSHDLVIKVFIDKDGGFSNVWKSNGINIKDSGVTLRSVLMYTLEQDSVSAIEDMTCLTDSIYGDPIDVHSKLNDIDYITECWEDHELPVIVVICSESVVSNLLKHDKQAVETQQLLSLSLSSLTSQNESNQVEQDDVLYAESSKSPNYTTGNFHLFKSNTLKYQKHTYSLPHFFAKRTTFLHSEPTAAAAGKAFLLPISDSTSESAVTFKITSIAVHSTENDTIYEVRCREYETVGMLKDRIQEQLRSSNAVRGENIILTYEMEGNSYELYNDKQLIYMTALYEYWKKLMKVTEIKMCSHRPLQDVNTLQRISSIIDISLDDLILDPSLVANNDRGEVDWSRRSLSSYVKKIVKERDDKAYSLSMEIEYDETPVSLALKIPFDNKITITFHYQNVFRLKRRVSVNSHAATVLKDIFSCIVKCKLLEDENVEKYCLQVSGENIFLDGQNELITFSHIRKCLMKSIPIHLSISDRPLVDTETINCDILSIDPNSNHSPLHTDISRKVKNDLSQNVCGESVWDHEEEYIVTIAGINNLPTIKDKKKLQFVISVSLYHANKELVQKTSTSSYYLNDSGYIECNETIQLSIQTKNIPKAAKLMICIQDELYNKDTRRINYWILAPVYDHRGILCSGFYTFSLWKGPTSNRYVDDKCHELTPCAPCVGNPDPNSVQVTLQFPHYKYPVFLPSFAPESYSVMLKEVEDSATIRMQSEKLLSCILKGQLKISAFSSYVAQINWARLSHVIEVYSLLKLVESKHLFAVDTVLKLLDSDFTDENVRSFAVKTLEKLPDEQLEIFLLQLTQAIKFELRHDNSLVRLLLKRALTNKRIGHFFFWYLKSEMDNPFFAARYAVLLEAYLKGCGNLMLRNFETQIQIQNKLESIGKEIKQIGCNDSSKAQSSLHKLIDHYQITEMSFVPVYNPRLLLGQLNPLKCKIMTSKKKPLMLELCNVNPSALMKSPTRLILKLGDDLRQDVIVLRMFALFEKLWRKEGLPDLCLIPYGCMSTGHKTGFIEVVANAKTIAEVVKVNFFIKCDLRRCLG
jgi:phosphatidylinositol-4,5-bisphosphate 3-kinase